MNLLVARWSHDNLQVVKWELQSIKCSWLVFLTCEIMHSDFDFLHRQWCLDISKETMWIFFANFGRIELNISKEKLDLTFDTSNKRFNLLQKFIRLFSFLSRSILSFIPKCFIYVAETDNGISMCSISIAVWRFLRNPGWFEYGIAYAKHNLSLFGEWNDIKIIFSVIRMVTLGTEHQLYLFLYICNQFKTKTNNNNNNLQWKQFWMKRMILKFWMWKKVVKIISSYLLFVYLHYKLRHHHSDRMKFRRCTCDMQTTATNPEFNAYMAR